MGLIKHFFALNTRGNPVVFRSFLTEMNQSVIESFYQRMTEDPPPPPVFKVDSLTYAYIFCNGLYFVVATTDSMSPTLLILLLRRITAVLSDYMGKCTESFMQKNLALVYEVVDEAISFGCPQATDSANLLHLVHNQVSFEQNVIQDFIQNEIFAGESYDRPLAIDPQVKKSTNELYLIINEKLSMTLSSQNQVLQSTISGVCTCKSFLQGVPQCSLQIDPQCYFMSRNMPHNLYLKYDDITFSPNVVSSSFDSDRSITFVPPDGTSLLFTYRTQRDVQPPFIIQSYFENTQAKVVVVRIAIQSTFPVEQTAQDVIVHFQCPVETSSASCELPNSVLDNQSSDYDAKKRQVNWHIKKFGGLTEFSGRFRFMFDNGIQAAAESLLGPISLDFTIIGGLPSGLNIKNFIVSTQGSPRKWCKEVANAGSYTFNFI